MHHPRRPSSSPSAGGPGWSDDLTVGRGPAEVSGPALVVGLGVVGVLAAVLALVRLPRVQVEGASMLPVLAPGDRLLVLPLRPRRGRLVVVPDPRVDDRMLVKRVSAVLPDGQVDVRGDNAAASTDSRQFGPLAMGTVIGRPVYRYHPSQHAGWLWRA